MAAPIRFNALADSKSWEETNITTPSFSDSSPAAPVISRVRTERVFRPAASGPTFEGVAVAEYIMTYGHAADEKPVDQHGMTADYTGIMTLDGVFNNGAEAIKGSLVLDTKGRYEGAAKGDWSLVKDSVKGDLKDRIEGEVRGGYVSAGMVGSEAWLEFAWK